MISTNGDLKYATECTYSITSASKSFVASGGTDSVGVTAKSGCDWTAVSNDYKLVNHVTSGSSGTGDGTVNYSVSENTGYSLRIGTMTIAGEAFTVTQSGNNETTDPTVTVDSPKCGTLQVQVFNISGTSSDDDSGIEKVEIKITDGVNYLGSDDKWATTAVWIKPTAGTGLMEL